ncbi:MAG: glycerol-3-phosphate acyltransferase [Ghiorsea sp.]|nr:glycerol-3-phosphate acyltransferase [Ghiorsea sp.]
MQQSVLILATASYFIGAIPFGILFARWLTGKDPREHGSGNTGATNALRTGGKKSGCINTDRRCTQRCHSCYSGFTT